MLNDPLLKIVKSVDRTYWALVHDGQADSQNPDLTVNVVNEDGNTLLAVPWFGGVAQVVMPGTLVKYGFDASGQPMILGSEFVGASSDFAVLGSQLVLFLQEWLTAYLTHTHASFSAPAVSVPTFTVVAVPAGVLSTSTKVQQ